MTKYKKINALFKKQNFDLFDWIIKRAKEEDVSLSTFIIRSLKKIREIEDGDHEKTNFGGRSKVSNQT